MSFISETEKLIVKDILKFKNPCDTGGVAISIQFVHGFEKFGAYEDWDEGWIITVPDKNVRVSHVSLEKALRLVAHKLHREEGKL